MNVQSQFSILSELKNPAALEPHTRLSEAVQYKNVHLASTLLMIVCKLMLGIMLGILKKVYISLHNFHWQLANLSYLPENANKVEQRIRIFATVVMVLSLMLRLIRPLQLNTLFLGPD